MAGKGKDRAVTGAGLTQRHKCGAITGIEDRKGRGVVVTDERLIAALNVHVNVVIA